MTTDKIDFMLRDLEKQVHDFTLVKKNKRIISMESFTHSFGL